MKMQPYTNVDEYLANFSGKTRERLDAIRKMIKEEVPEAGEKISYGIPTITLQDKYLMYFAGYDQHVSVYPIPSVSEELGKELKPYISGKGTLKFLSDKPLPLDLIHKVLLAHIKRVKE